MTESTVTPVSTPPADAAQSVRVGLQATACIVTVLLCLGIGAVGLRYPARISRTIPVDDARVAVVKTGIDPNTAGWFEIAQLPGIGPALAKRVVEFRESELAVRSRTGSNQAVFSRPGDLARVKGIGHKTVLKIGRFLRFPDQAAAR